MPAPCRYPEELRERAVKMVLEIRQRDGKGHGELAGRCRARLMPAGQVIRAGNKILVWMRRNAREVR